MRGFVLLMGEDLFRVQLGILAAKCRADNIFFHQMYFSFVLSGFVPLAEQDLFQVQPRNLAAKSFLLILRSSSLTELEEDLFRFVSRICFGDFFNLFLGFVLRNLATKILVTLLPLLILSPPSKKDGFTHPNLSFFKTGDVNFQTKNEEIDE